MRRGKKNNEFLTLATRRWLYGIAVAVAGVLAVYGVMTAEQIGAVLGLAAAVLGVSTLALAHPTKSEE